MHRPMSYFFSLSLCVNVEQSLCESGDLQDELLNLLDCGTDSSCHQQAGASLG